MTDLTPNDLSHLSDAEFHALCPQGEHAPGPEPLSPAALSPAAQAIVAAVTQQMYDCNPEDLPNEAARIAYTLRLGFRALADAVVPEEPGPTGMRKSVEQFSYQEHRRGMRQETRADILSIATELENHD